jgi:hypothetical protein
MESFQAGNVLIAYGAKSTAIENKNRKWKGIKKIKRIHSREIIAETSLRGSSGEVHCTPEKP